MVVDFNAGYERGVSKKIEIVNGKEFSANQIYKAKTMVPRFTYNQHGEIPPPPLPLTVSKPKKMKSKWSMNDPEMKRRKRIAKYKYYAVEGKVKSSFRNSFRWIKSVNFASAGTGFDNATSDVVNVMPLWKELEYYKDYQKKLRKYMGFKKANNTLCDAIYLISLGTNDFMQNYYLLGRRALEFNIEQYQDFLIGLAGNFVSSLYSLGARKIALVGLPPMGCLPLERLQNLFNCNDEYNKVAQDFNGKLHALVRNLNKELPSIQLVYSDVYGVLLDIIEKPYKYGFDNAALACCGSGMFEMGYLCNQFNPFTCTDANKYVFWDAFHLTEKTNQIISSYFMKNISAKFL